MSGVIIISKLIKIDCGDFLQLCLFEQLVTAQWAAGGSKVADSQGWFRSAPSGTPSSRSRLGAESGGVLDTHKKD